MLDVRDEDPSGPAARLLWDEYIALVRERLGPSFAPTEAIFADERAFTAPGAAWVVGYDGGRPVACGGLRPLGPGVGEIKRMFVSAGARRRGHGRTILRELERRAAAGGLRRIRLLTTEVLEEARSLYLSAGYEVVDAPAVDGRRDFWLERELPLSSDRAARPAGG